jgi:hypothetical protein
MKATPEDLVAICSALPEVELGTSWGDNPTFTVPLGPKGRGFVMYREPRKDAIDPSTGDRFTDLIIIMVADEETKMALVQDAHSPYFTIDHFNGYNAVLVQASRLGEIEVDDLREVLTEAWACRAPKRLVKEYFASRDA